MQLKKLTSDIEITEFLIQQIQNPTLSSSNLNYQGICQILSLMRFYGYITEKQKQLFISIYIEPKIVIKSQYFPFLFQPRKVTPRVEFLQNLLEDLQKT